MSKFLSVILLLSQAYSYSPPEEVNHLILPLRVDHEYCLVDKFAILPNHKFYKDDGINTCRCEKSTKEEFYIECTSKNVQKPIERQGCRLKLSHNLSPKGEIIVAPMTSIEHAHGDQDCLCVGKEFRCKPKKSQPPRSSGSSAR